MFVCFDLDCVVDDVCLVLDQQNSRRFQQQFLHGVSRLDLQDGIHKSPA